MAAGRGNVSKQKLAKAALAKANTVEVDLSGITGDTIAKLSSLSQSLDVTYDGNNNVATNGTNDDIAALQSDVTDLQTVVITTVGANHNALATEDYIIVTALATITLPTAVSGVELTVKNVSATDTVTIDSGTDLIDGSATYALTTQYEVARLLCDGTTWHLV